MSHFETLRTDDKDKRVVCEINYDELTIATKFGKSDIRFAKLDTERLSKSLEMRLRGPPYDLSKTDGDIK